MVVAGGGPAGCATALSLRRYARGLSVAIVEASGYGGVRIGETLPPHVRPVLEHLGVWDAFLRSEPCEVYGTAAAWGEAAARPKDFVFGARGPGWHVDRAAFDGALAWEAERAGATLVDGTVDGVERDARGLRVRLGDRTLGARFVVDATGHSAVVSRAAGAIPQSADALVAFARFFDGSPAGDPRTVVEAFSDGWWYTAGLPNGRRVAACVTDADIARKLRLRDAAAWSAELARTRHVAGRVSSARPAGGLVVRPMHSRRLSRAAGAGWLAVGDSACSFDPLSSQGIFKALRSGIFGSYALADALAGRPGALDRYARFVSDEFDGYLRARALFYDMERRWSDRAFWRRRARPHQPDDAPS
ncbi:MAG TPA: NAD(P)/FAD-dependent oxidoreductase [Actinomycetota bacterium]|nr:NAD(P)/FAD-dependent oxidoreductase [Actinomycetota bacterium]